MKNFTTIAEGAKPWLEVGYNLFLEEGHEGLQVERLARILGRNKSGFYHFFGEHDTYLEFLMRYHLVAMDDFIDELKRIKNFSGDYLHLIVKYKDQFLFNSQLVRNHHVQLFNQTIDHVNADVDRYVVPSWAEFVGLENDLNLARRYYFIIRDVIYARVTPQSFGISYFSEAVSEARGIVSDLSKLERHVHEQTNMVA